MMPSMQDAFFGLEDSVGLTLVKKTVSDHDLVEASKVRPPLYFQGVLQPMKAQQLLIKPEGERAWKWWTLLSDMEMEVDDIVRDSRTKEFRVVSVKPWTLAGYFEYELQEGPGVAA